jgi:hypothetical protein
MTKKTRRRDDYYPTPPWAVDSLVRGIDGFVERVIDACGASYRGRWLEPHVGDGSLLRAFDHAAESAFGDSGIVWTTNDIRPEVEACECSDFLEWSARDRDDYDVVPMNPPYRRAEEHVRTARSLGHVVLALLRVTFVQSERRAPFLRGSRPGIAVIPHRLSFDGEGTDNAGHAWFIWGVPSLEGTWTTLPDTALAVRRDQARAASERLRLAELERHGQQRLALVSGGRR